MASLTSRPRDLNQPFYKSATTGIKIEIPGPSTSYWLLLAKLTRHKLYENGQASQSREKGLGEKIVETNFSFFDRFFSSAIKALFAKTLRVVTWAICIFFLGVVIFGDRGVVDYMKRHQSFIGKVNQLKFLEKENEEIKFQIYRLENDPAYQRQIIRDYLGYIARDEYLVIFAENAAHSEAK